MLTLVSNSVEGAPLLPTASYIAATLKTRLILLFSGLADSWVTLTVGRDLGTHQPVTPSNSSYRELWCWVFYIHFIVSPFFGSQDTVISSQINFSAHYSQINFSAHYSAGVCWWTVPSKNAPHQLSALPRRYDFEKLPSLLFLIQIRSWSPNPTLGRITDYTNTTQHKHFMFSNS